MITDDDRRAIMREYGFTPEELAAFRESTLEALAEACRAARPRPRVPLHERHHGDAGLESGEPERQLGEHQEGGHEHHQRVGMPREELLLPAREVLGMLQHLRQRGGDDDDVQQEVEPDDADREANRLLEALDEDRREQRQQDECHAQLVLERRRKEGIPDDVRGRVGGRERDGDDEVGGGEPQQAEHQRLAAPPRQQLLEHRDAPLPVGAVLRHAPVDRQRAEERQQHQDERRDRRQHPRRQRRDARLVAERREIVDAGQAHDLVPGMGMVLGHLLLLVEAGWLRGLPLQQPALEPVPGRGLGHGCVGSQFRSSLSTLHGARAVGPRGPILAHRVRAHGAAIGDAIRPHVSGRLACLDDKVVVRLDGPTLAPYLGPAVDALRVGLSGI